LLPEGADYDPNYLKLNPKGGVPTLVHDGKPVSRVHPIYEGCTI
jgi:glutathione S-transferase